MEMVQQACRTRPVLDLRHLVADGDWWTHDHTAAWSNSPEAWLRYQALLRCRTCHFGPGRQGTRWRLRWVSYDQEILAGPGERFLTHLSQPLTRLCQLRGIYGDQQRFEKTYFQLFNGANEMISKDKYITGDACRRDKVSIADSP